jgi:hypothetical protein
VNGARSGKQAANATVSAVTLKLPGSSSCSIKTVASPGLRYSSKNAVSRVNLRSTATKGDPPASLPVTQYVCYWPEDTPAAAENQFRDLVSLLEVLMPSSWSAQEQSQIDELSRAKLTVWSAQDSMSRPAVRLYLSGQSVGLHVAVPD